MKVLAVESSNADSFFQQLDKLRMVYEEYLKIGKETIPNAEKDLHELTEELDQKTQALDDVIINSGTFAFKYLSQYCQLFREACDMCIFHYNLQMLKFYF